MRENAALDLGATATCSWCSHCLQLPLHRQQCCPSATSDWIGVLIPASQKVIRQQALCSLVKILCCCIISFPIFYVEAYLFWLSRCINDISARACIMDSEAISPVDWSFLLRNIDHTILMLIWRHRSYFMDGRKIQIKSWQVKFAIAMIRRAVGEKSILRNKKKERFLKQVKEKDEDLTLTS